MKITGKNLVSLERKVDARELTEQLRFEVRYSIPPVHDSLVISASQLDPVIDRRNEAVYRDTLFSRDDQVFHTLDAGINAGQREGGGKSLEIRRFGFNLDHPVATAPGTVPERSFPHYQLKTALARASFNPPLRARFFPISLG